MPPISSAKSIARERRTLLLCVSFPTESRTTSLTPLGVGFRMFGISSATPLARRIVRGDGSEGANKDRDSSEMSLRTGDSSASHQGLRE